MDTPVATRLRIRALDFSIVIGLPNLAGYELATDLIFGRISGARLPRLTHELVDDLSAATLWIELTALPEGKVEVQFRGDIESPRYVTQRDGLHWDFSKVLNAIVLSQLLKTGLVPLHGACIETAAGATVLTGPSGAGKSSISYAALLENKHVYATELGFYRGETLECANSALTVDRAALTRFRLSDGLAPLGSQADKFQVDLPAREPVHVARTCFIQVNDGDVRERKITSRRARMLLFENVVTQLPVTQLLAQETWPLWLPPPKTDVDLAMRTVEILAELSPRILEGHPKKVLDYLCEEATPT